MAGKIIVFEGPEGCGKTTQAKKTLDFIKKKKKKVVLLREPGGVKISEAIRSIILDVKNRKMSPKTELFLYEAARAQVVSEKISGYLRKGCIVILDRYYLATTVYQGYGRGLDRKMIAAMNFFATEGARPSLTIIYDVSPAEAAKRMKKRGKKDRIELERGGFHKRVRDGYLKESKSPGRVLIKTDGLGPEEVFEHTVKVLS
jgi:dTMP kinase